MKNSIILYLDPANEDFISLSTYAPERGHSIRFLICRNGLREWLSHPSRSFLNRDLDNSLQFRIDGDIIHADIMWCSVNSLDEVSGYRQRFSFPESALKEALYEDKPAKLLIRTNAPVPQSSLVFSSGARDLIRDISSDKLKRRALSKALRRSFHYGPSVIYLYRDSKTDFFFRETSSR